MTRKRSNGKKENYHTLLAATMVVPGHNRVLPVMPEFIAPQDSAEKQDCERNAAKRWKEKHGEELRAPRPVYLGDDLFSSQPMCDGALWPTAVTFSLYATKIATERSTSFRAAPSSSGIR